VGMHHDPLLSGRGMAITNWGHSWIVLGVIVRLPLWPGRALCLPILFRMDLNHDATQRARRNCRTGPELAVEMLSVLCQHRKSTHFHVLADRAYGGQSVLCHWGIENSLHWALNMTFREDESRIRRDHGPENFATLRRAALGLIKQDKSKGSVKKKRKRATWNNDALLTIVQNCV